LKRAALGRWRDVGRQISKREKSDVDPGESRRVFGTDHYRNYPAVLVNLLAVKRELLGRMIEGAWRLQASRKQVAAYDSKAFAKCGADCHSGSHCR